MSRRFTLFALIAALCLLLAGCSALFIKAPTSHTGTLIIPLRPDARKASNPLELCARFEFTLSGDGFSQTTGGTTSIEFDDIPFGTYTLEGTAYGLLSEEEDAEEEIVATCNVEGIVIASEEPQTISVPFYLSEAALIYFNGYTVTETETNENGDTVTVEVTYTGTDKTAKLSETETTDSGTVTRQFTLDADGNNVTDNNGDIFVAVETTIETAASGNTITVTEFSLNNNGESEKMKETVTEPSGKVTTSEFNLNSTTQGCTKRVTVVDGNTTTVSKYNANDAENPIQTTVTKPDTTVIVTNYTAGSTTKTSQTETKPDGTVFSRVFASSSGNPLASEIETRTDGTQITTQFSAGKKTTQTEKSSNNTYTVRTFNTTYDDNPVAGIIEYETGHNPAEATEANPNNYYITRTISYTFNGDGTTKSTTTAEFEYTDDRLSIIHYDQYNNPVVPYVSQEVTLEQNGSTVTTKTTYTYCDGEVKSTNPMGRQATKTTEITTNGIKVTTTETYTYDDKGRIIKEESTAPGYVTKEWVYEQKSCIVYARDSSNNMSYSAYTNATPIFIIPKNDENAMRVAKGQSVTSADVLKFLTNNYVLCGDSETDLNWVRTKADGTDSDTYKRSRTIKGKSEEGLYNYIYKINHSTFAASHSDCMSVQVVGDTAYVIVHNDKGGCSNFWGSLSNWRYTDPDTGTVLNYGLLGTQTGAGGN